MLVYSKKFVRCMFIKCKNYAEKTKSFRQSKFELPKITSSDLLLEEINFTFISGATQFAE